MPRLQANGVELNYEDLGAGDPLLFIHGLGGCLRDWDAQLPHFVRHHRVIAVDMRGHGESDKPEGPYSMAGFAADIRALLKGLGLGPVHVCGISMGGMIAFQLAADAPELVRSLTIVNSGPAMLLTNLRVRRMIWQRALLLRLFSMRRLATAIAERLLPREDLEAVRRAMIERMSRNQKRHYRAAFRAIVGWSVLEHLPSMTMPTLILAGELDYSSPQQKQAYVDLLPNARMVVIPQAHHALPMEWPERFNRALEGFLLQVESAGDRQPPAGTADEVTDRPRATPRGL